MLGIPNVILLGILTFVSLVATMVLGILFRKGKVSFKYHRFLAYVTLILAAAHAALIIF